MDNKVDCNFCFYKYQDQDDTIKSASKININKNTESNERILQFLPGLLYNQNSSLG
jgi:hypothetical protein